MSKIEKLLARLLSRPSDFTWDELVKVLSHFGYIELKKGKTGGTRRKFSDDNKHIISLHKPYPENKLKRYMIDQIILILKEKGYLKND